MQYNLRWVNAPDRHPRRPELFRCKGREMKISGDSIRLVFVLSAYLWPSTKTLVSAPDHVSQLVLSRQVQ